LQDAKVVTARLAWVIAEVLLVRGSRPGADLPLRVPLKEGDGHRFSIRIIPLELRWS
jgi:hypothetical protein